MRVLVVDDDEANRYQLEVLLSAQGWEVVSAANGSEALEEARGERPDLIVTDILMPVMDGYTLCRACKQDEVLRDVPLVFYTATYTGERDRRLALSLGAEAFIVKPAEPEDLVAGVIDAVETARDRSASQPDSAPPPSTIPEGLEGEGEYLRQYSVVLVHKLEDKLVELEETQRRLRRDIAARERAERDLVASRARYQQLVETMPAGLWTLDAEGRTAFANPSLARMLGCTVEEMLTSGLSDFVAEDDRALLERYVERRRAGVTEQHDFVFTRRDGARVWAELATTPLLGADGSYEGALAVVTDVTDQRGVQRDRDRLVSAVERSRQAIAVGDERGVLVYANAAFLSLCASGDAQAGGRPLHEPCGEIFGSGARDEILRAIRSREPWSGRCGTDTECGGGARVFDLGVSPVTGADERLAGFAVVAHDVTEVESLEARLHQARKLEALGALAGGIAHDFNNILMVVGGQAELLRFSHPEGSEVRERADAVVEAADKARDLVRQLLAFGRQQAMCTVVLDLNELIERSSRMLRRVIREDVELETDLEPSLWAVRADPTQMDQVLLNLVVNARDALPAGGRIVIRTRNRPLGSDGAGVPGAAVVVEVRDNGTGMSEETRVRIFEPFFSTKGEQGTGLGLATVYGIVRQSGGEIEVASAPGAGTAFTILLPPADAGDAVGTGVTAETADVPAPAPATVLLIEDDPSVRSFVSEALRGAGYTVVEASSGDEADACFQARGGKVDLVITDVVMPGRRGPAVVAKLRASAPGLRALYMSGYLEGEAQEGGSPITPAQLMEKPFSRKVLLARVHAALQRP